MTQPTKKQIVHDFLRLSHEERADLLTVLNGFNKPETNGESLSLYDLKGLGKGLWGGEVDKFIEDERNQWD